MILSEDAEFPACPDCETNVMVSRATHNDADWHCQACDTVYVDREMLPSHPQGARP